MIAEQEFQQLTRHLHRWEQRRKLRNGLIWSPRGLLTGLMLAVLLAAAARFWPLLTNRELAYAAIGLGMMGLFAGISRTFINRHNLNQQAQFADTQFDLKERTSTAIEIHQQKIQPPARLATHQFRDTMQAVKRVRTRLALPLRLIQQDWLLLALTLTLLAVAVYLPNPQAEILQGQRAVETAIGNQVENIENIIEEIRRNPDLTETQQEEELTEPLENALAQLQPGNLNQQQTMAVLSAAEADLRTLEAENNTQSLRGSLQNAGTPLANNPTTSSLGQALQNGDLAAASSLTNQMADVLPELTPEQMEQLAANLAETAAALSEIDSELAQQLADAAQALQNGDIAAAQQALRQAAGTFQQRAQASAAAQQAGQASEQLAQGRNEVAQAGQGGEGAGQPGEGSGQGQAQGQGEGSSEGQGSGSGLGAGAGNSNQGGTGGPGPGGGHTDNVYIPPLADFSDEVGVDIELPAECLANPAACGSLLNENATDFTDENSNVPYQQVFGDYRDAAYEALDDDYIPLGMKDFVRDYFSSLEP